MAGFQPNITQSNNMTLIDDRNVVYNNHRFDSVYVRTSAIVFALVAIVTKWLLVFSSFKHMN